MKVYIVTFSVPIDSMAGTKEEKVCFQDQKSAEEFTSLLLTREGKRSNTIAVDLRQKGFTYYTWKREALLKRAKEKLSAEEYKAIIESAAPSAE